MIPTDDDDPLRPAFGIINAVVLGSILYALVALATCALAAAK